MIQEMRPGAVHVVIDTLLSYLPVAPARPTRLFVAALWVFVCRKEEQCASCTFILTVSGSQCVAANC